VYDDGSDVRQMWDVYQSTVHTTLKIRVVEVISQALQNGWVQSSTHSQAVHNTTECLHSRPYRFIQGEVSDMLMVGKTQIQSGCEGEENKKGRVSTTLHLGAGAWLLLQWEHKDTFCDILLTVHLSIFISVVNQLDAHNLFYNKFISCFYMFRASYARNM